MLYVKKERTSKKGKDWKGYISDEQQPKLWGGKRYESISEAQLGKVLGKG